MTAEPGTDREPAGDRRTTASRQVRRRGPAGGMAALLVGAAIGATAAGGTALLLYTGQGFIRAAGLLVSSTIMAVAAGIWAGSPEPARGTGASRPPPGSRSARAPRGRWLALVLTMLAGGVFAGAWMESEGIRSMATGGAIAVLLVLAMPAYAAGSLLAALQGRQPNGAGGSSGVAAGALAGSAIGVLTATGMLIQTLEPSVIYYGAAALLACAALLDRGRRATPSSAGVFDMTGHVTLITGVGARGQLGYTVARTFLEAGATVTITARTAEVEPIAAELSAYGPVTGIQADLLDQDDVAALVAAVRERDGRLDSLINTAGGLTVTGSLESTTPEQWRAEIQRNAETALLACRAALPLLRESRGAVVNFTSPAATRAAAQLSAYSAAKAAVVAITQALALEEKDHGVRANAVSPGAMDTQQNRHAAGMGASTGAEEDAGRTARDDTAAAFVSRAEVADVVLFLASHASRGISGQTIPVPGPTLA